MSWLFSQALVAEYSGDTCSDGEPSVQLSGNPTQPAYLSPDKMTEFSRLSRFGMTFRPLTADHGEAVLMSYLEAFPVRTLVQPEREPESLVKSQECGFTWPASWAKYDPNMSSWKTRQCSLLGDLEPFSETWPRWGTMRDGEFWGQQMSERPISETESGLWPTPNARDWKDTTGATGNRKSPGLGAMVHWPTPTVCGNYNRKGASATSGDGLATAVGGSLNPDWVEWLMNWPITWSGLNAVNRKEFQRWQEASAAALQESGQLRAMWWDRDPSQAPSGQRSDEQPEQELGGSLQQMPRITARQPEVEGSHEGSDLPLLRDSLHLQAGQGEGVQQGVREQAGLDEAQIVPRVATGVAARVDRLKAIGNGQVPAVAATAWRLLK